MKVSSLIKVLGPPLALGLGIFIFVALLKSRPDAARAQPVKKALLVETATLKAVNHTITLTGQGEVQAGQQIILQPEVSARVSELHPNLVPGGLIAKGETVVRLETRDFRLNVAQQQANVAQARFNLELEQGRKTVAEREWELLGKDIPTDPQGRALALRQPHIRSARANLSSAQAAVQLSQRNIEKAQITAPFNALVLQENTDVGQLASPQTQLASLVGTDYYWVQVSIPLDHLPYIDVPGVNATAGAGAEAQIVQPAGAATIERDGKLVRLLGNMDPVGRLARVIVRVDDPLNLKDSAKDKGHPPLLLGAFVEVQLKGRTLPQVVPVAREALRGANTVWLMKPDQTLDIRTVDIIWRDEDTVYVKGGLQGGEALITSRINAPVKGMALRDQNSPKPAADTPKADAAPKKGGQ